MLVEYQICQEQLYKINLEWQLRLLHTKWLYAFVHFYRMWYRMTEGRKERKSKLSFAYAKIFRALSLSPASCELAHSNKNLSTSGQVITPSVSKIKIKLLHVNEFKNNYSFQQRGNTTWINFKITSFQQRGNSTWINLKITIVFNNGTKSIYLVNVEYFTG